VNVDLFADGDQAPGGVEPLAPGAVLLRGFALAEAALLIDRVEEVTAQAPFRHLVTPGGFRMSVAMTNCGELGWVADRSGYRYDRFDPDTGRPWPPMPPEFRGLATGAAAAAGFAGFAPDACLVNRYATGAKLSLHQDADEPDATQPIVSVSLGAPATFLFGGAKRADKARRVSLNHGDVVVWGGPSRRNFHGVLPLKTASHFRLGELRLNLTFRKAS
jgi:alkylated DNA repair protein (DNA oxidative demethylase)